MDDNVDVDVQSSMDYSSIKILHPERKMFWSIRFKSNEFIIDYFSVI